MDIDDPATSLCDTQTAHPDNPASLLFPKLIRHNSLESFALSCDQLLHKWIILLSRTAIPLKSSRHDGCIQQAFRFLDNIIRSYRGTIQALAYLRLIDVFDNLKSIIRRERKNGLLSTFKRGNGDDSIAIDICGLDWKVRSPGAR
ncbi:hypothetical protein QBC35DRAFT_509762 [Podospora australis]|uniref:Uncharacterized protein n=1 Tax=Podospora australis TaxID=1536484 RepID=A0AAN7AE63_9PEZI|nr:hypothetical protein QBC35DRAFT_509762 [Podospora australis]